MALGFSSDDRDYSQEVLGGGGEKWMKRKEPFENLNSFATMRECSGDTENVPELPAGHDPWQVTVSLDFSFTSRWPAERHAG